MNYYPPKNNRRRLTKEFSLVPVEAIQNGQWDVTSNSFLVGNAVPTVGAWSKGDTFWNSAPTINNPTGWICVTSGNPGTWQVIGKV